MKKLVLLMASVFAAGIFLPCGVPGERQTASDEKGFLSWAETPPMGWNSWDCYGPTVREDEVKANADTMAERLMPFGWKYVVVDIRWYVENDKAGGYNQTDPRYVLDSHGRFQPAVNRFPSAAGGKGFKPLADYVHGKGLKFGIHIMRGVPVEAVRRKTPILGSSATAADIAGTEGQCRWLKDMYTIEADRRGAQRYYDSIFELYASWGVDYVKVDDLSSPYHRAEVEMIRKAIDACGRPIVLSASPGATPLENAEHVKTHANCWRISDDFWDRWEDIKTMFGLCRDWAPHGGPGHWPDADMLPLGRIGIRAERGTDRRTRLTADEQITLMSLWAVFRSPLMFGGDLPSSDDFTFSLLTNPEVLAVNQSAFGSREVFNRGGHIVWMSDAPDSGDRYVALFNTRDSRGAEPIPVSFSEMGLESPCRVRDLWKRKDMGIFEDGLAPEINPHGAALYKISPGAR